MERPHFEEIQHTADLAMCVRGKDLAQLLEHAAEGMLHLSAAQPKPGKGRRVNVELQASDREQLLVVWLEELLFGLEAHGVTYRDFEVEVLEGPRLAASMRELKLDTIAKHVKAVTFHDLRIIDTPQGLEATIVFDV